MLNSGRETEGVPANSDRPLRVGSRLSDNHHFVNLSVGYRPEADIHRELVKFMNA
jgi:hypothetical protein